MSAFIEGVGTTPAAAGITGAAGSTRVLVEDMTGITARMDTNQEIVGELQRQMDVFSNL